MLERRTGDSRNDVGLRPGGIVRQGDLEIGSLAGDMSLYLAPPPPPVEEKRVGSDPELKPVRPGSKSSEGPDGWSSVVASIESRLVWVRGESKNCQREKEREWVRFCSEQGKMREGQNGNLWGCLLCFGRFCRQRETWVDLWQWI